MIRQRAKWKVVERQLAWINTQDAFVLFVKPSAFNGWPK